MKLRAINGKIRGKMREAEITPEHPASSYERPVLLVDGLFVGTVEATLAGYRILDATDDERAALAQGGYALR